MLPLGPQKWLKTYTCTLGLTIQIVLVLGLKIIILALIPVWKIPNTLKYAKPIRVAEDLKTENPLHVLNYAEKFKYFIRKLRRDKYEKHYEKRIQPLNWRKYLNGLNNKINKLLACTQRGAFFWRFHAAWISTVSTKLTSSLVRAGRLNEGSMKMWLSNSLIQIW